MTKKYPTKEELKSKLWYRLFEVFFWLVIVLTGFAPFYRNSIDPFLDATTGIAINLIILLIFKKILLYIVYGPKDKLKEVQKNESDEPVSYKPLLHILIFTFAITLLIMFWG
jgi:hypothetical protein